MKVNLDCPVCGVCMESTPRNTIVCPICKGVFMFSNQPDMVKFTKSRLKEKGIEFDGGVIISQKS